MTLTAKYRQLAIVLIGTGLLLDSALAWKDRDLVRKGYPDFTTFYSAGLIVRAGQASHLYLDSMQFSVQQRFAPDVVIRHGALPYIHSPFEALLFVPFTYISYFRAYLLWNVMSLGLLLATIFLLGHYLGVNGKGIAAWMVASLSFFPAFMCLLQGQDLILEFLLLTLVFVSLQAKRDIPAGIWLGMATFRPQLALPLALILLFDRRYKVIASFVITTVALTIVSMMTVGWHEFLEYPKYVWGLEQKLGHGAILPTAMPNLRGLVAIFAHDGHAPALALTGAASVLLLSLAIQQFRRARMAGRLDLAFGIAVLTSMLISYHAFVYDLTLLLLPIMASFRDDGGERPRLSWTTLVPLTMLFCTPLLMVLWLWLGRLNYFVPVLLLFFFALRQAVPSLPANQVMRARTA
jgi:alpha-1,2-mannosyltransferase